MLSSTNSLVSPVDRKSLLTALSNTAKQTCRCSNSAGYLLMWCEAVLLKFSRRTDRQAREVRGPNTACPTSLYSGPADLTRSSLTIIIFAAGQACGAEKRIYD